VNGDLTFHIFGIITDSDKKRITHEKDIIEVLGSNTEKRLFIIL